MQFRTFFIVAAALVASPLSHAQDYKAGNLRIAHLYARATVPNQSSGAAYLSIENEGKQSDKLVSAASPIAGSVEIHTMSMDGNVMKMREVAGVELKPSAKLVMQPGDGYHLMLTGLKKPLKAGDKFPLTLVFEKSGKIKVSVRVEELTRKSTAASVTHQHH